MAGSFQSSLQERLRGVERSVDRYRHLAVSLMRCSSVQKRQLGATLYVLEKSGVRIGSPKYIINGTYGLSTLNNKKHVKLGRHDIVHLRFVGKKKILNTFMLKNSLLQKWLRFSRNNGLAPFAPATVVRVFLKQEFNTSPKDYRTWRSNVYMCTTKGDKITRLSHAASQLHHSRSISKKYYIHPDIAEIEGGGKNAEIKMRRVIKKW